MDYVSFSESGTGPVDGVEHYTYSSWPMDARDFHNQIAESVSFRSSNDAQVHEECVQFNETSNYDYVPVVPTSSAAQPFGVPVLQNAAELPKFAEKIECIESGGPVFSAPQPVHELVRKVECFLQTSHMTTKKIRKSSSCQGVIRAAKVSTLVVYFLEPPVD